MHVWHGWAAEFHWRLGVSDDWLERRRVGLYFFNVFEDLLQVQRMLAGNYFLQC
jgi:hypothetical protein